MPPMGAGPGRPETRTKPKEPGGPRRRSRPSLDTHLPQPPRRLLRAPEVRAGPAGKRHSARVEARTKHYTPQEAVLPLYPPSF